MFDDPIEPEHNAFRPVAHFHRMGAQKVFYKGKAPKVKETAEEKAFAEVSEQRWNYYKDNFRELENDFIKQVDLQDSEGAYQFAKGSAASATTAAFDEAHQGQQRQLQQSGINPNSSKYKMETAGLSDAEARSSTDTSARAQTSQQDEYLTGVQNVVNIGRGQATKAQNGLGDVANTAQAEAVNDARTAFNDRAAQNSAIGSVVGTAASLGAQSLDKDKFDFSNFNKNNQGGTKVTMNTGALRDYGSLA